MSEELDQVHPEDEPRPEEGQEAVDQGEGEQAAQPNQDEDRARRMGWVPKEEFRGDPTKWVSAEEFNRRGDEQIPLLRSTVRKLEQKLEEQERVAKQFAEFHQRVEQDAYNRALATLKQKKIEARQNMDVEAELAFDDQIAELKQKGPPKAAELPAQEEMDPEFVAWLGDNQWANDPEAQAIAMTIGAKLRKGGERSEGRVFMDKIKREMLPKYPHFFPDMENTNRQQPAAVAQNSALPKKGKKTFADLPSDAKSACRDFVKRGYLTEDQYVKQFFGE